MGRILLAALAMSVAFVLTGCDSPAVSVRPLYVAGEKPVPEPLLAGEWIADDPSMATAQNWKVTAEPDGCYRAELQNPKSKAEKASGKEDEKETYRACLVRIQEKLFFDSELIFKTFGARNIGANDLGPGVTANHIPGRLWVDKDLLRLVRLDSKWIKDNTPEDFRTQESIITGSTEKLRQLVAEHADDPAAWTSAVYLCRPAIDCQLRATEDKLARSPNDADVLQEAGAFYLTRGDITKGVSLMRHAVELKPKEATAHGYMALALGYQRDFEGARRELATAYKLDNQAFYEFYIGFSYFLEGKYQEAAREFAALGAGNREPDAATILFSYFSLVRAGRDKEGRALLAKETGSFSGSGEDQLLLLQAAGRVTDPAWGKMSEDTRGDVLLLYAENCLVHGDTKAARAAFDYVLHQRDEDPINELTAMIELERLQPGKRAAREEAKPEAGK